MCLLTVRIHGVDAREPAALRPAAETARMHRGVLASSRPAVREGRACFETTGGAVVGQVREDGGGVAWGKGVESKIGGAV